MPDREKVLKGLEICKEESKLCFGESECGYQSYFPRCWITLAADALELLKAQEPRALTLPEYNHLQKNDVVWLQDIDKAEVIPAIVCSRAETPFDDQVFVSYIISSGASVLTGGREYGRRFIAWTSRPTDAQREAAAWT